MIIELKTYLESKSSLPVFAESEPTSNTAETFLKISKTDNGEDLHESAEVTVEAYGTSIINAYNLINNVKEWMMHFTENSENVASVRMNTIYQDNDTAKLRYRYRGVWHIELL